MFQIRVHGRGGQGVVTASELLAAAAFADGWHAQAFPSFGSERTGAPVVAFCRLDDVPIRTREPIAVPDALIVQDSGLIHQPDVLAGLAAQGYVIVNTTKDFAELGLDDFASAHVRERLVTVPATDLARAHLGRPVPNAALLGGFAALTGVVSIDAVAEAIRSRFAGRVGDMNEAAARAAFDVVRAQQTPGAVEAAQTMEVTHARTD